MKNSPKVALIEDDIDLLEMFKLKLKLEGFNTVTAEDGVAAIKLIQDEIPDVILLDMLLPLKDGFEVLRTIKGSGDRKIRSIPIIVITNLSSDEDIYEAKKLGASEYLVKVDITPADVISKITDMLYKKSNKKR
ncbi:MAG: response regulator [Candidatus Paceibacterota bacterium]|jgi:DNA-binding response OmpR family regulator